MVNTSITSKWRARNPLKVFMWFIYYEGRDDKSNNQSCPQDLTALPLHDSLRHDSTNYSVMFSEFQCCLLVLLHGSQQDSIFLNCVSLKAVYHLDERAMFIAHDWEDIVVNDINSGPINAELLPSSNGW